MQLSRRQLLAALTAASAVPRVARAASVSERRFIFVYTMGGWDSTRVFADLLGEPLIATESDAFTAFAGGISFVDHASRPFVRAFFEAWHDRCLVVNGVYCPSISHSGALRVTWTNDSGGGLPDWPTRIAAAQADRFVVPYLVVGGPYFAGANGVYVCRAGNANQLSDLVKGDALSGADLPATPPTAGALAAIDEWLLAEGGRMSADPDAARARAVTRWTTAQSRALDLKLLGDDLDLSSGEEFSEQIDLGVRALATGLSRVVSLTHPRQDSLTAWDSHALNDLTQSELFESLFLSLGDLLEKLSATPAPGGGMLSDITTVVVMSEMGRTPYMNASGGKDHWPYTTALYIGPAVTGDRVVGGFDEGQYGRTVDLQTGEMSEQGNLLRIDTIGATLLRMADIDPAEEGVVADPIEGVLA